MLRETADHVTLRRLGTEEICVYDAGQGSAVVLIHGMFGFPRSLHAPTIVGNGHPGFGPSLSY
jgi:hypothetical protein